MRNALWIAMLPGMATAVSVLGPTDLFGLLRPFRYATLTAGAAITLVILLPLGLLAGIVADVLLGIILIRASGG